MQASPGSPPSLSSAAAAPLLPTPMEEYLFDLRGFLVLKNVISPG
jgi:hypothetical protein